MVSTTDLDEIDNLLVAVRVALTKKERVGEPRSATVTDPVTGEDVALELPELSDREIKRIDKEYEGAISSLKDKVASLK